MYIFSFVFVFTRSSSGCCAPWWRVGGQSFTTRWSVNRKRYPSPNVERRLCGLQKNYFERWQSVALVQFHKALGDFMQLAFAFKARIKRLKWQFSRSISFVLTGPSDITSNCFQEQPLPFRPTIGLICMQKICLVFQAFFCSTFVFSKKNSSAFLRLYVESSDWWRLPPTFAAEIATRRLPRESANFCSLEFVLGD